MKSSLILYLSLCLLPISASWLTSSALARGSRSFTEKIDQQKSQRADIDKKIVTTDRSIVVLKTQLERLKRELADNMSTKSKTEKEINDLNRELADAAADIERLKIELDKARDRHESYRENFCQRLVYYHRMQSRPLLGLLFNSENMSDLMRRFRYYSFLSKKDTETLVQLQMSRDDLARRKAELEKRERSQAQLKRRLERKNASLLRLIEEQDRLMVRVRKEKLHAQRRVKKLRRAHSYLSKKIASLQRAQSLLEKSSEKEKRRKKSRAIAPGSLDWPVDGDISISRPFGYSENIVGTSKFSAGIDIQVSKYSVIKAAASGKVVFRGPFSASYGNIVMLDHGGKPNNVFTIYGNLDQIFVPKKKYVERGTPLGSVGAQAALRDETTVFHFEIRKRTTPVDPLKWLKTRKDDADAMSARVR